MSHSEDISNAKRLDLICDEFEAQWIPGVDADFSSFLTRVKANLRQQLRRLLLEVDIELRVKSGQQVSPDTYQHFGEDWVQEVQLILRQTSTDKSLATVSVKELPSQKGESIEETEGSVAATETTAEFMLDSLSLLTPGRVFGRYKIIERLGGGGMGSVYRAQDTLLERHVALKVPHIAFKSELEKEELIKRFHREAKAMATLNHPNLCQVHDVGCIDEVNYITMALVEGQALSERLRQEPELDFATALRICQKMALALHQAHQNRVIHRDLKPANIMLTGDEEPIVIDFGLARRSIQHQSETNTSTGKIVGTLAYMSPEQGRGETDKLTHATDIFSFGVILFRMLTGRLPFQGKGMAVLSQILMDEAPNPTSIRSDLPSAVDDLCQRLLAKDPNDRFDSMRAVAEAVDAIVESRAHRADVQRLNRKTLCPDYEYDVFISYSPADNEPSRDCQLGWISTFIQDLEWRICQLHGVTDEISVVHSSDPIHESQAERPRYLDAKQILIINSPGYSNSIWSMKELAGFRSCVADKIGTGNVLVVEKDRSLGNQEVVELSAVTPYRFWGETSEGSIEHYSGHQNKSRYLSKIDDLARRLVAGLQAEASDASLTTSDKSNSSVHNGQRVYLAEVTDDLDPVREEMRRYLEQVGIDVYPKTWHMRERDAFVSSVERDLKNVEMFVQLLGPVIGKLPPGAVQSYAQLQVQCAETSGIPIVQWRAPDTVAESITDESHRGLVFGPRVQSSAIQEFKRDLSRELDRLARQKEGASGLEGFESFVFINVEPKDVTAADEICQVLDQSGMCYAMPLHEGRPAEIRKDLEENLVECDALIIYYGESSGQWVREQLRHWRRVLHKRDKPIKALALYEGPPDEKAPIGMRLPKMELLNCRHGLDYEKIQQFLSRLHYE